MAQVTQWEPVIRVVIGYAVTKDAGKVNNASINVKLQGGVGGLPGITWQNAYLPDLSHIFFTA